MAERDDEAARAGRSTSTSGGSTPHFTAATWTRYVPPSRIPTRSRTGPGRSVKRFQATPQFARDFRTLEPSFSPDDEAAVYALLAEAIRQPTTPRRIQSFYDPSRSSWLLRSGPFLVHYAIDDDAGQVVLLDLFRRR